MKIEQLSILYRCSRSSAVAVPGAWVLDVHWHSTRGSSLARGVRRIAVMQRLNDPRSSGGALKRVCEITRFAWLRPAGNNLRGIHSSLSQSGCPMLFSLVCQCWCRKTNAYSHACVVVVIATDVESTQRTLNTIQHP